MNKSTILTIAAFVFLGTSIQAPASAQQAPAADGAGACYVCADADESFCSWAVCVSVKNMLGYGSCFASNVTWRCNNGCYMDAGPPCFELAIRLDGGLGVSETAAYDSVDSNSRYDDLVLGQVERACQDVIVRREYDEEAATVVRRTTARVVL